MCVSEQSTTTTGDELYDMSGNVKEWVLTTATTTGPFEMRGGAYNTASFTVGSDDQRARPAVRRDHSGSRDRPGASAVGRVPLLPHGDAASMNQARIAHDEQEPGVGAGSTGGRRARVATAAHAQSLRPNIMLLLDTSGSMLDNQRNDVAALNNICDRP